MRDVAGLAAAAGRGDRRAIARLLTVVEDGSDDERRSAVASLHPTTGGARTTGLTGPPGVGKSSLTNAMATSLRRRGRSVAILAVDPSSPFTGGALLGDRIRMQGHHADAGVFIRSMAARGRLGGLSTAAPLALLVLDAAGFDDVLVETVGVGQSEVDVASITDHTVVVLAPGMGDAVQAAKAGILEVADVFVVNKADHPGAGQLHAELRGMLELTAAPSDGNQPPPWRPPIVRTVAVRDEGVEAVVDAVDEHTTAAHATGSLRDRRRARAARLVRSLVLGELERGFSSLRDGADPLLARLAARVEQRELDPYEAADRLLGAMDTGGAVS